MVCPTGTFGGGGGGGGAWIGLDVVLPTGSNFPPEIEIHVLLM